VNRLIDKIKAEYEAERERAIQTGKEAKARKLRAELVNAITKGISPHRLEEICNAEREGWRVAVPTCVCDLCENGTKNKQCYVGGVERCVQNGVYTMFSLRYGKPVSEVYDDPNH